MSRMHLRRELDEAAETTSAEAPAPVEAVGDLLGSLEVSDTIGGGMGNDMLDMMADQNSGDAAQWASDDEDGDPSHATKKATAAGAEPSLLDLMGSAPPPAAAPGFDTGFPSAAPDFASAFPSAAPDFGSAFPSSAPNAAPAFPQAAAAAPDFTSGFPSSAPNAAPAFPPAAAAAPDFTSGFPSSAPNAAPAFPPAAAVAPDFTSGFPSSAPNAAPAFPPAAAAAPDFTSGFPPAAAPAAVPSSDPFSTTPAPSSTDNAATKAMFDALLLSDAPGLLFKNEQFEVLYQHEFRGAQCRIKLKHTNNSSSNAFNDVQLSLSAAEPQFRTALTPGPGDSSVLAPGAGQTYLLMMECKEPYQAPPVLTVTFTTSGNGSVQCFPLKLPVLLTRFMAAVQLGPADFTPRWDRLTGAGLEAGKVIATTSINSAAMLLAKLQQLKTLGVNGELSPDGSVLAASTLQTGAGESKVVVGCMLKATWRSGQIAITVRTASPQVSPCVVDSLAAILA